MNEIWIKRTLLASAAWNITGAITSLADPSHHFAQMYSVAPPGEDPLLIYFYACTWINVLAWGLAYLLAAYRRQSRSAVLVAGAVGKALYFLACAMLVYSGVGRPLVLVFGIGDLAMALLFGWALRSQLGEYCDDVAWGTRMKRHLLSRVAGLRSTLSALLRAQGDLTLRMACTAGW